MNKDLQDYVIQNRRQGMSNEQIKENLLSAGWPEAEINQALGLSGQPLFPSPPPPARQSVDISGNKGMAILAYLGILIIIPFLTEAKNDPFVKFHIKQGIGLIIFWLIVWALSFVFETFMVFVGIPLLGLIGLIFPLLYLASFILMVVGIANAVSGKMKELPLVGSWGNRFNF